MWPITHGELEAYVRERERETEKKNDMGNYSLVRTASL
jgi:hypothetical protein